MIDYTIVVGVDRKHLAQLSMVLQTWRRHKPSLFRHPIVLFFDRDSLFGLDVWRALGVRSRDFPLEVVCWPPVDFQFSGDGSSKWENPQRHKMLAGFVHVPAEMVKTRYWLKLDTDVTATGMDDWIDPYWFEGDPAIVCPPWSYTRPANQMMKLDEWAAVTGQRFPEPPMNLMPNPGCDKVHHQRICSWCGFFRADFTRDCSVRIGGYQLPVSSQDGYLWYCAQRLGERVIRAPMKQRGWRLFSTEGNIRRAVEEAMR